MILGKYYLDDGSVFEGVFKDDEVNGFGLKIIILTIIWMIFIYLGKQCYENGNKFEGEFKDFSINGFGNEN